MDLFGSGACASCCPKCFASDFPLVPLKEESPTLKSVSGKTLEVLDRDGPTGPFNLTVLWVSTTAGPRRRSGNQNPIKPTVTEGEHR